MAEEKEIDATAKESSMMYEKHFGKKMSDDMSYKFAITKVIEKIGFKETYNEIRKQINRGDVKCLTF